ncbi:RNA polymerase sigma factor (sigma-70 family) [Breznakia sp. PF5-3]|uniref:RNA polymerase sigma factor n=1 Tax=unclassified Breznakia TaxID=2623764 RepID=UPI00240743AE|nr:MULTISPECIES: sigma-70 family RNA polymerase sigma factor [unclassified Breznakia]MDF9825764.1 RNA polymerase sigma factor (sigma-70 family) [Breznakia sp. PM6-1]MDF9836569.1 RNA polymerase sigma factor (sigma-70 family) [Breznakia sp. PF5-3]MDF9838824.1 RNA polymerase sigma factor (sigma-70 family) [Breznakia sp. PFB2-8]MDF9860842.1 RNA polymerase sigma factor (sigma-70 family) [Breznakia sp. PH5-24]
MKIEKQYMISKETIIKARKGETEAFATIYKTYFKRIHFIANQFVLNDELAKDLAQDIFVTIYENIKGLNEPSAFHSWIKKITYNKCINYNRVKFRTVTFDDEQAVDNIVDEKLKEPIDIVEGDRIMGVIESSLNEMNESLKCVGLLRYFEGYSIQEIASTLEIPRGTVKSRLFRIKSHLKNNLKAAGISPKSFGCALFLPNLIAQGYQCLYLQTSVSAGAKIVFGIGATGVFTTTKVATTLLVATVITILPVFYLSNRNQPVFAEMKPIEVNTLEKIKPTVDEAKIVNVYYDEAWTREPVLINVELTNQNYDEILIDDEKTNYVYENGRHTIKIIRNGNIIDQKEIDIANIDIESPYGRSEREGNSFKVYLSDDTSYVNPNTISLLRNGIKSKEFAYDQDRNILSITTKKHYQDELYISDYAGNIFKIEFE